MSGRSEGGFGARVVKASAVRVSVDNEGTSSSVWTAEGYVCNGTEKFKNIAEKNILRLRPEPHERWILSTVLAAHGHAPLLHCEDCVIVRSTYGFPIKVSSRMWEGNSLSGFFRGQAAGEGGRGRGGWGEERWTM